MNILTNCNRSTPDDVRQIAANDRAQHATQHCAGPGKSVFYFEFLKIFKNTKLDLKIF